MTTRSRDLFPSPDGLLLAALEERWRNYRAQLKRCRAEFSNDAVHDVRVALRRLLSLIRLLDSMAPRPRLQKLSRALKHQLDGFDDLRDTQVVLAEISARLDEFPQLRILQEHLEKTEKELLKKLRKRLKKLDLAGTSRRIRKTRETLRDETGIAGAEPVLRSVDEAFTVTKGRLRRVDPAQPASIHRVRIAFKKFRYMVEIVHPLLGGFPAENLKRMNDYQSLMGAIQDLEVLLHTLEDPSSHASALDLETVRRYYEARRTDAVSAFIENRDALNDFWRETPGHPFPWEGTA